jgi:hypothetical protein
MVLLAGIVLEFLVLFAVVRANAAPNSLFAWLLKSTQEPGWYLAAVLTPLLFPHAGFEGQIAYFLPTILLVQGAIYGALGYLLLSISWRRRGPK